MTSKPLNRYSIWCGNWIYHFCSLSTLRWAHTTTIIISYLSYERNNFIVSISVGLLCCCFFFSFVFYYGPFLLPTRCLNIICVNKTSKYHNKFTYSTSAVYAFGVYVWHCAHFNEFVHLSNSRKMRSWLMFNVHLLCTASFSNPCEAKRSLRTYINIQSIKTVNTDNSDSSVIYAHVYADWDRNS